MNIYRWDAINIKEFSAIRPSIIREALYVDVDSVVYAEDAEPVEVRECCVQTLLSEEDADEFAPIVWRAADALGWRAV